MFNKTNLIQNFCYSFTSFSRKAFCHHFRWDQQSKSGSAKKECGSETQLRIAIKSTEKSLKINQFPRQLNNNKLFPGNWKKTKFSADQRKERDKRRGVQPLNRFDYYPPSSIPFSSPITTPSPHPPTTSPRMCKVVHGCATLIPIYVVV